MALQDPNAPLDPMAAPIETASAAQWEWPAEFRVDPSAWGIPTMPMPEPAPPQQIGGTAGMIEQAAAPALANAPAASQSSPVPGQEWSFALPTESLDGALESFGPAPAPAPASPAPGAISINPAAALDRGVAKVGPEAAQARWEGLGEDQKIAALTANPALLQQEELDLETERLERQREMIEQARANDQAEADRIAKDHVAAVAKAQAETQRISAEAMQLANTKIVRDRRSGGRRFLDVIMGALGGLVSARTGGPNQGLQLVLQRINDDVEDQKAELQNKQSMLGMRRSIVGEELARSGDMYKAQELARIAAYDATMSDIATESMKYRPGSSRVVALSKMRIGLAQQRQAALDALQDRDVKRVFDRAKAEHALLENEALRRKNAGIGKGAAPQPIYAETQLASPTPPPGWTKGTAAWLDVHNKYLTGRKSAQELDAGGKVGEEKRQQKLVRGGIGLFDYDANGNKVEFVPNGLDTEVAKLRAKKAGTQELVNILDEAMSIRTGWTSDKVAGEENQRLKTLMGKAQLAAKKAEDLGAITESDVGLIKGLLGTDDFTSWRGVTDAVAQARQNLIKSLRIEANGQGMSARGASEIDFPNLYAEKTKLSQEEGVYQSLLGGKLEGADKTNALGAIAVKAQSTDPKVNGPARAQLRKLAEDAPDEVDRRSIKNWLMLPQFGGGQQ